MTSLESMLKLEVKESIDISDLQNELAEVQNESQLTDIINENFEDPNLAKTTFKTHEIALQKFHSNNKEFRNLNISGKEQRLESALFNLGYVNDSKQMRFADNCDNQYQNDIQTCQETALVEAAFCGLLSPTILGALGCGAGVVALRVVCGRAAERTRDTCKSST